jgi:hypothetical protein
VAEVRSLETNSTAVNTNTPTNLQICGVAMLLNFLFSSPFSFSFSSLLLSSFSHANKLFFLKYTDASKDQSEEPTNVIKKEIKLSPNQPNILKKAKTELPSTHSHSNSDQPQDSQQTTINTPLICTKIEHTDNIESQYQNTKTLKSNSKSLPKNAKATKELENLLVNPDTTKLNPSTQAAPLSRPLLSSDTTLVPSITPPSPNNNKNIKTKSSISRPPLTPISTSISVKKQKCSKNCNLNSKSTPIQKTYECGQSARISTSRQSTENQSTRNKLNIKTINPPTRSKTNNSPTKTKSTSKTKATKTLKTNPSKSNNNSSLPTFHPPSSFTSSFDTVISNTLNVTKTINEKPIPKQQSASQNKRKVESKANESEANKIIKLEDTKNKNWENKENKATQQEE